MDDPARSGVHSPPTESEDAWLIPVPTSVLHPVEPGRSPLDDALVAARGRATADATARLGTFLPSPAFADLGPTGVRLEATPPALDLGVDDARRLVDEVLTFEDNRPPRFGIGILGSSGGGDQVDFRTTYDLYRPTVGAVIEALEHGAVIAVNGIDGFHRGLSQLCADLHEVTGEAASADLLLLGATARFTVTADPGVDWFLLVLDGAVATDDGTRRATTGQALAIGSRGRGRIEADGAPAVVVRVAVRHPTAAQLVETLVARAQRHPMFRADLPADLTAPVHSYGGSLLDQAGRFGSEASRLVDEAVVATHRTARFVPTPPRVALSDALALLRSEAGHGRLTARAAVAISARTAAPVLVLGDYQVDAPPPVQVALAEATDRRCHDVGTILATAGLASHRRPGALRALARAGLLSPCGSDGGTPR